MNITENDAKYSIMAIAELLLAFWIMSLVDYPIKFILLWNMGLFIVSWLVLITVMVLLARWLSTGIAKLYNTINSFKVRRIIKWSLLFIAWGRCSLFLLTIIVNADFTLTKEAMASVCIFLSCFLITWDLTGKLFALSPMREV